MRDFFFFFFLFFFFFFSFFSFGKKWKKCGEKKCVQKYEALFWCDDDDFGAASSLCPLWSPLRMRFLDDDDDDAVVVVRRGVVVVLLQQLAKNDDTKFGKPFGRR